MDSFRRLIFEFGKDISTLHRPIYDDKEIALPFAPYISNKVKNPYFEPPGHDGSSSPIARYFGIRLLLP
ncbi:MAG: hypothetical protein R2883_00455 [Caldisericia bacterium]